MSTSHGPDGSSGSSGQSTAGGTSGDSVSGPPAPGAAGAGAVPPPAGPRTGDAGSGGPAHPDTSRTSLGRLAELLRTRPPSCGPVRLVGVDGHAGSGKTTFAAALASALGGAPVLHLDDLASHASFFGWTERFDEQVLAPLSHGLTARFTPYDWERGCFPPGDGAARTLPPAPVVLVEGVGAGRRALRPWLACLLWMDVPRENSWRRGRLRDGPRLTEFWNAWSRAEIRHFAEDSSYSFANFVVRQGEQGYEVREGPAGDR